MRYKRLVLLQHKKNQKSWTLQCLNLNWKRVGGGCSVTSPPRQISLDIFGGRFAAARAVFVWFWCIIFALWSVFLWLHTTVLYFRIVHSLTTHTHAHTHLRLMALFPGLPGWAGTRMVKPIWILLKQGTMSGSGISWAICKSAPRSRQITTPALHLSVFYRLDALPAAQPTASKHWRPLSTYFWKIQSLEICVVLCKPCMCIAVGLRLAASHWLIAIFVMLISIVIQQL